MQEHGIRCCLGIRECRTDDCNVISREQAHERMPGRPIGLRRPARIVPLGKLRPCCLLWVHRTQPGVCPCMVRLPPPPFFLLMGRRIHEVIDLSRQAKDRNRVEVRRSPRVDPPARKRMIGALFTRRQTWFAGSPRWSPAGSRDVFQSGRTRRLALGTARRPSARRAVVPVARLQQIVEASLTDDSNASTADGPSEGETRFGTFS